MSLRFIPDHFVMVDVPKTASFLADRLKQALGLSAEGVFEEEDALVVINENQLRILKRARLIEKWPREDGFRPRKPGPHDEDFGPDRPRSKRSPFKRFA